MGALLGGRNKVFGRHGFKTNKRRKLVKTLGYANNQCATSSKPTVRVKAGSGGPFSLNSYSDARGKSFIALARSCSLLFAARSVSEEVLKGLDIALGQIRIFLGPLRVAALNRTLCFCRSEEHTS